MRLGNAAAVFAALGDDTRLQIVARLSSGGPQSIMRLTEAVDVTRQAVTKHLEALAHAGLKFEFWVDEIEPPSRITFRWHPFAIDPKVDYSSEPKTLVEFRLEEVADGTKLVVTESGFDGIPAWRRDEAFRMNSGGWAAQVENIRKYVAG